MSATKTDKEQMSNQGQDPRKPEQGSHNLHQNPNNPQRGQNQNKDDEQRGQGHSQRPDQNFQKP
jgi:hypothetical protein